MKAADSSSSSNQAESLTAIGSVVAGRYRIMRLIGEGGMGAVYEAEHVEIGKRIAVKLIQAIHARHTEIAARFRREARSASAVESDHIVQVFDAGTDPDLGLFMAMELLRGEELGGLLARTGRLDPESACGLVLQAASALDKAHTAGIIHRDLKPANIFLVEREDGTAMVKLVDFGIAKIVRDESNVSGGALTRMGSAVGTPNYMSPEQAQGLTTLDHRTDIYSLGAVLYEMVVGEPPFPEMPTYEQTILQIMTKPAPRAQAAAPHIPPALDALIFDMMKADAAHRVGRMKEVRDRILALYPGLEKARLRFTSKTAASSSTTVLRVSGRPASGVALGAPTLPMPLAGAPAARLQTNVAVTYDAGAVAAVQESLSPAGVPRKTKAPWLALAAFAGLSVVAVVGMLVRSQAKPEAPSAGGIGLVTSVPATAKAPSVLPPAVSPPPAPPLAEPVAAPAVPLVTSPTTAVPAVSATPTKAPSVKVAGAAGPRAVKVAPATTKDNPPPPAGQVGGVGIASEF